MLAGHGLVESELLELHDGPVGTDQEVLLLLLVRDVVGGVVRAHGQVHVRVALKREELLNSKKDLAVNSISDLLALDKVVLHPLRPDLVGRIVRTREELRHLGGLENESQVERG